MASVSCAKKSEESWCEFTSHQGENGVTIINEIAAVSDRNCEIA